MQKLNKTFKINPLYEADGYKVGHPMMIAPEASIEYWTWIPRSVKYMPKGIDKIMSAGQQITWRYIHSVFQENFFDEPIEIALKYAQDMSKYLGLPYTFKGFEDLHKLGYLPVRIKALPEGMFTKPNIPHMTGVNTEDYYAWLGLYLETLVSKLSWQCPTAATIAFQFKKNAIEWVKKTDPENLWLADFMCHDFHSRGGNPFTSIAVGLAHSFSNLGSDTLNVIPAARYYYDFDENEVPIFSVNASEHSVTCTGIFYYQRLLEEGKLNEEIKWYYSFDLPCEGSIENPDYLAIAECINLRRWLRLFPTAILSVVSDTFDLWKLITFILPRCKDLIMSRNGKLVIRPDSGNPVDIICGSNKPISVDDSNESAIEKGVIELLWEIFGGEITSTGYKRLDSHIGAIYGDSINLERQVAIYERLESKKFAATNIVLGVGSYTYVMLTRDSAGWAAKGAWFQTIENFYASPESVEPGIRTRSFDIYKDPVTDDGTKKSLKGLCRVDRLVGAHGMSEIFVKTECSEEEEGSGLLQVIYENGKFYNQTTLEEIRKQINHILK
jgi:nicotinamide phosphoribosyltransferase